MLRAAARIIVSLWLLGGAMPAAMAMFRHSDAPASAGKRVALVIGVNKYPNLAAQAQLQRAVNDARAVAKAFGELGFEVTAKEDTGRTQFNAEWQQFLGKIGDGDTVAFYFAGHGVEIEGLNFLIPGDIPPVEYGRQEQIKRKSIAVAELLLDLHKRRPRVVLIILDACREHPLIPEEYRSAAAAPSGLAKIDAPEGTFIMYSASAGQTALDRLPGNDPDPVNSVYTRKLLPLMRQKGVGLVDLARKVREGVHALAATVPHQQTPAYYDNVLNTFCLAGCEAGGQEAEAEKPQDTQTNAGQAKPAFAPQHLHMAVEAPPAPARPGHVRLHEWGCDGLLVAVAHSNTGPCIKAGSGESFKDCPDCPEMVIALGGSFSMGSPGSEPEHQSDESARSQDRRAFAVAVCGDAGRVRGFREGQRP